VGLGVFTGAPTRLCGQRGPAPPFAFLDVLELSALAQFMEARDRRAGGNFQAESRLRPLARRRASTFWPFVVAIRDRKPWRRLRTRRLGW